MTYEEWMQEVNNILTNMCGVDSGDLVDVSYKDMYEDEESPLNAATHVLDLEGYFDSV